MDALFTSLEVSTALAVNGGLAYVGAQGYLRVRHWHWQSKAEYAINCAKANEINARADAIRRQSMIAATGAGGTATIFNEHGVISTGEINRNVPNHFVAHAQAGAGRTDSAPAVGSMSEPYANIMPSSVAFMPAFEQCKTQGLLKSATLDLLMGVDAQKPLILPLHFAMHTGGCGTTGTGKSSITRAMLAQLMLHDPLAERVRFCLIDFEGRELNVFKDAANTWAYCSDGVEASATIANLYGLMQQRATRGEAYTNTQKFIVVAIEELMDVLSGISGTAGEQLDELYRKGRKCRIFVISASQFFQAAEVGRVIKGMVRTKLMFYHNDDTVRAFGFKPSEVAQLQGRQGRYFYEMRFTENGPFERGVAQAPWITIDDVAQLVERNAQPAPVSKGYTRPRTSQATRPAPEAHTIIINGAAASSVPVIEAPEDNKVRRAMLYWRENITKAELMRRAQCSESTAAEAIRRCKRGTI